MNWITADFNWISLVLIAVAGIIGVRKSRSGKSDRPFETNLPEFDSWTAEPEEEHWDEEEWERTEATSVSPEIPEDSDHWSPVSPEKETPESTAAEEEQEEHPSFDIRQAIISSEILKRPEF